MLGCIAGMQKS